MKELLNKYADKMVRHGLAEADTPLLGGRDAFTQWNREDANRKVFEQVFELMDVGSLVFARPAEPYADIIDFLASRHGSSIRPRDCETRTFLHDIPVTESFEPQAVADALFRRKAAVIPGKGVVSFGTVSPEQGFVFYSSVCFACFVLFFSDYLAACESGGPDPEFQAVFEKVTSRLPVPPSTDPKLANGPFADRETALAAMAEAGRAVVDYGLVDSFFGNLSCLIDNTVLISQTGSSLDELEGCIDPCPRDGSSCAGLTASSELSAHEGIYDRTNARCILHGHPKFSVIMSMVCDEAEKCENASHCHIRCREPRTVGGAPVVPGEVGTGPTGLCNTLPPAMAHSPAAIVHGHGVFAVSDADFNKAFRLLLETEKRCHDEYFRRITANQPHIVHTEEY
jgi:ribulose-5-phosphate 4-epimerase/fuculose-1-phosphate aldolase